MANRKQVNESKNGGQKMGRTLFEPCTTQVRPKYDRNKSRAYMQK